MLRLSIVSLGSSANLPNALTIPLKTSTWFTMVSVECVMKSKSSPLKTEEYFFLIRSAESWIGVNGLLISCAILLATSLHAASFWACMKD